MWSERKGTVTLPEKSSFMTDSAAGGCSGPAALILAHTAPILARAVLILARAVPILARAVLILARAGQGF